MLRIAIALLLFVLPVSARAAWTKAESEHFIVYSQADAKRLKPFVEKVEHFDSVLRKLTGLSPEITSPNKLIVFAVSSEAVVQRQLGKGAKNVAGFYRPVITGSFAVVPQSAGSGSDYDIDEDTVLFHEYVHHFMLQYFPAGYAPWYVEGFAEYLSTTEFKSDGTVNIGLPARFRFYGLVVGDVFPVKRMFAPDMGTMSDEDTGHFYAWSWLLTHYLNLSPERSGQLKTYLDAFAAGEAPEAAATKAFGDLAKLQKDLVRYRDGARLGYLKLKNATLPVVNVTLTQMDEAQSAMMPLFIRFTRGSRNAAEVESFVQDARAAAARFPNHPMALEMLAEGELDARRFDAATAANTALLSLQPQNGRALLRKARIGIAALKDDGDAAAWKAIRPMIVAANRAANDDPFPLQLYFESYARAGLPPPPIAVTGLVRAMELAPQVPDVRFMLAAHMMTSKKPDQARIALAPLLNDPHSPQMRKAARAILDGTPMSALEPDDKQATPGKDK